MSTEIRTDTSAHTIAAVILIHGSPGSYGCVGLCGGGATPGIDSDTETYECTLELLQGATHEELAMGGMAIFAAGARSGHSFGAAISRGLARIVEPDMADRYRLAARADASRRRGLYA